MRSVMTKLFLFTVLIGSLVASAATARADSGSPFNPGDGRINPMTGDKVAVYCNASSVAVWGIDGDGNGFPLTTFSLAELTGTMPVVHKTTTGTVSLKLDSPAITHVGYQNYTDTTTSLIVDTGAQYHITWLDSTYGADGSAPFLKTFSCTYLQ